MDEKLKNKIFDDMVFAAAEDYNDALASELLTDNEIVNFHCFSEKFEHNMSKLIRKQRQLENRKRYQGISRRVAVIALVCFLGLATVTMSVSAFRNPILNFFIRMTEKYTQVTVDDAESATKVTVSGIDEQYLNYVPQYTPTGYEIENIYQDEFSFSITYKSPDDNRILFSLDKNIDNIAFDTEDSSLIETEIKGEKAFITQKDGRLIIEWMHNEMCVTLIGEISQEEAIKIIESINY